jgi:glutamate racemase
MEPAVKPAAEHTRTRQVGVIATAATFQGELFSSLLDRFAGDVVVHTQICPELVPLVEAGELTTERTRSALKAYLAPLLSAHIDELVLGCTHYPFLRPLIEELVGPGVEIIDPAPAVARQTARVLEQRGWVAPDLASAEHRFYTSGDPIRFQTSLCELVGIRSHVAHAVWDGEGLAVATAQAGG